MSELKLQQCRLDGRYDVLECLGRGSYSEVYVARDVAATDGSPHTVVIKALNPNLQGVPDQELEHTLIENFRNEAIALDRVRHPNIISRLGHGTAIDLQDRAFHYLVLEYLPGGDLQALCRRQPLTLERALFYFEQVCAGLEHAHQKNVIHRDIKPSNLLLTADHQTVKIADFGVAKLEATEGAITRVGTDVYAAPEHHPLAHTGPLDTAKLSRPKPMLTPAADVYSLAKTTYMLLTGEAPRRFSQRPITELPASIADRPWAAFVLRVLRRATQTNPAERYQTVSAFWEELRDATMPGTQPLARGTGELGRSLTPGGTKADKVTPAPLPPSFEPRATHSRAGAEASSAHLRIVVPVNERAPLASAERSPERAARATSVNPREATALDEFPAPEQTRLSGRAQRWLVALLLITAFAGMLFALHNYVTGLRSPSRSVARTSDGSVTPVGREFVASTDVNLRNGPHRSFTKIGLVEKGSSVRVLSVNGDWCEVKVLEHGRPKEDPDSADQGWVDRDLLKSK